LAFITSAENRHLNIVKHLFNNISFIKSSSDEALQLSALKGHFDIVTYLLPKLLNTNYDNTLKTAAWNWHLDIVKLLVEQGTDIHAQDDYALKWSASNGHLNVVKYLVEQGSNIYIKNYYPFSASISNGHLSIVNYFIMDCNMKINKFRFKWLQDLNHLNIIRTINARDLNFKLDKKADDLTSLNKIKI
jgi:ankyrin repeat protein